jgi:hypothetical protein
LGSLWPNAVPFPSAEGGASPVLDRILHGPAAALTAVALVVGRSARASGWAAEAATGLAGRWPAARRVILVDLGLDSPSLHLEAGVSNDEGVLDVVEYGVSLGVVRQQASDGAYDVVAAGVYAPEPGALLRSPAWGHILEEAARERATLLIWVPADAAGADAIVRRAGAVIVLAEPDESSDVIDGLPDAYAVLAVLTPHEPEPVAAGRGTPDLADVEELVEAADVEDLMQAARALEAEWQPPVFELVPEEDTAADSVAGLEAVDEKEEEAPVIAAAAAEAVVEAVAAPEPPVVAAADEALAEPRHVAPVEPPVVAAADEALAERPVQPAETKRPEPEPPEPVVAAAGADELLRAAETPPAAPVTAEPVSEARAAPRLSDEEFQRIRLPTDRESRETLIADLRARQRAARLAPPPDAEVVAGSGAALPLPDSSSEHARDMRLESEADGVRLETLAPETRSSPPPRSRYRHPLLWTLVVVLIVSAIGGSWRFLQGRLGMGVAVEEPVPVEEPVVQLPRTPPDAELPYAVAMEAHTDLAAALRRLDSLAQQEGFAFHVVPLERDGTLYYHIMAGPVPDSASALALRDTLLARRLKTTATPNDVRHSPLAFLIGDYGGAEPAVDAMTDLRRLDVPGYMLLHEAADGVYAYRVYVGGFASAAEAEVTRQLLRAAGIHDSLVTRTGSIP